MWGLWFFPAARFLSTSPLRGTTVDRCSPAQAAHTFLSTSPLRGTTHWLRRRRQEPCISIHVPLAGDDAGCSGRAQSGHISIHVPLAGDDSRLLRPRSIWSYFYPRPPCGGRRYKMPSYGSPCNFYPRPPCGGRPGHGVDLHLARRFLSTSPLRGTTVLRPDRIGCRVLFLSTSPLRGTTWSCVSWRPTSRPFLSTSPLRGTTVCNTACGFCADLFLSTSPLRGTTLPPRPMSVRIQGISIHVPLAGDDSQARIFALFIFNFYPRPPCGGRHAGRLTRTTFAKFLSTSPLRGTTWSILLASS